MASWAHGLPCRRGGERLRFGRAAPCPGQARRQVLQPARKEHEERDDEEPQHARVEAQDVAPDEFLEQQEAKGADDRRIERSQAADQHHHNRLHGQDVLEHVGGIDIADPGCIDGAGRAGDEAGENEGRSLVIERVDAQHDGRILVLLDAAERPPDLGAGDEYAGANRAHGQQHHDGVVLPGEQVYIADARRQVEPHAAAGEVRRAVDDLSEHDGGDEARHGEIVAAQAQDRRAHEQSEERCRQATAQPAEDEESARFGKHDARPIGTEAEEGRGRERRIARHAADDVPGGGERDIHGRERGEADDVVAGREGERHQHEGAERQEQQSERAFQMKPRLPRRPVGLKIRSRISSVNDSVKECSGPKM